MPATLNGITMNFIIDTGANNNLLFNDTDMSSLNLEGVQSISLKGIGLEKPIEVITSIHNTLEIGNLIDENSTFKIFQNAEINFSERLGISVHGIIGSSLFSDYLTTVDYEKEKIMLHKRPIKKKKLLDYDVFSLEVYQNRFFITPTVELQKDKPFAVKLLLDTGATDSVWLFEDTKKEINIPDKHIEDYLGSAIGGDIHGKISRLYNINMGSYSLKDHLVSFPDSTAVRLIKGFNGRNGSIGAGLLKRFNYVIDINRGKLLFKRNKLFEEKQEYNMSGIELIHDGSRIISTINPHLEFEVKPGQEESTLASLQEIQFYKFKLVPIFKINQIRANSPAETAGLKIGDQLLSINGKKTKHHTIQEITHWLSEENGKEIIITAKRDGKLFNFNFKLKRLI